MKKIYTYNWNELMEVISFVENEANFHPRWTVNYDVTIKATYCKIDFGENTLGNEGTFWVSKSNKKEAVASCLEEFLGWYSKFQELNENMKKAISAA